MWLRMRKDRKKRDAGKGLEEGVPEMESNKPTDKPKVDEEFDF